MFDFPANFGRRARGTAEWGVVYLRAGRSSRPPGRMPERGNSMWPCRIKSMERTISRFFQLRKDMLALGVKLQVNPYRSRPASYGVPCWESAQTQLDGSNNPDRSVIRRFDTTSFTRKGLLLSERLRDAQGNPLPRRSTPTEFLRWRVERYRTGEATLPYDAPVDLMSSQVEDRAVASAVHTAGSHTCDRTLRLKRLSLRRPLHGHQGYSGQQGCV
jgi:hypothetical protein